MRRKVRIGDVVEILTKKGKAYAQFSHCHKSPPHYGALLRILPGFYEQRPSDFGPIVNQKESFYSFFPLQAAINRGIFEIVGNEKLPPFAVPLPLFRAGNINPKTGKVEQWWLWDWEKSWRVEKLTDEQLDLPIKHILNDTMLIHRIEQGWTPRMSEAFVQSARLKNDAVKNPTLKGVNHFLLFQNQNKAIQAQDFAKSAGFESEITDDGIGFSLKVRQGMPLTDEYIEHATIQLSQIAKSLDGKYDAWEIAF